MKIFPRVYQPGVLQYHPDLECKEVLFGIAFEAASYGNVDFKNNENIDEFSNKVISYYNRMLDAVVREVRKREDENASN